MDICKKIKNTILNNKELTSMGFANMFSTIVLGIFWFMIAKIVSVEDYGFLSYHIALASIATAIALPGITNTVIIYVGKDPKIQGPIFVTSLISLSIASIILYFLFQNIATIVYLLGYGLFGFVGAQLIAKKIFSEYSKITTIQRIISIPMAILFYYIIGVEGIILGLGISFLIYSYKWYEYFKLSPFSFSLLKKYRSIMINNYGIDISKTFSMQLDKLIIVPIFGFFTLGNYYLAFQIISLVIIIPITVFQYILPQEHHDKSFERLKKIMMFFMVGIAIIIIIVAPIAIPMVFPEYTDSVIMIQIMILAIIPQSLNWMIISRLLANGCSKKVLIGSIIFVSTQIITIIILGKIFGIYGIAISLVLSSSIEFAYLYLQNKNRVIQSK